jgi:hypothetical protein
LFPEEGGINLKRECGKEKRISVKDPLCGEECLSIIWVVFLFCAEIFMFSFQKYVSKLDIANPKKKRDLRNFQYVIYA